ncbi:MAG: alpha-2-macroglobulin, partial [Chloroflexi bacterium]|nr:alpha-2-macroglobulin [Chloroflexota bacterium]
MARQVSRRSFLRATVATMASSAVAVACSGLPPISKQGAPTPDIPPPGWVDEPADGYVAVAPRALRSGQSENVSLALFQGEQPARSTVTVSLLKDGRPVADARGRVAGRGSVALNLPPLAEGDYQLRVSGQGFQDQAPIRVEEGTLVFVETDKPVYKPGQTIHIRVLALDPALKPASGEAVVEAMDAKGIKVFKKAAQVDDFGMASLDLPLSTEPNLGVWKVRAAAGKRSSQVDVRVERYVLPKYEVKVELPREWALASERLSGTVGAEYSFGKPVKGEVEIVAVRYVGTWQEYARVTRPLDGKQSFELPAVGYAAGSPAGRGMASVRLDVAVREQATGYEEKTSRLITIAASPVSLQVIPEGNTFKPALPFSLLVVAETPDKKPVDTQVQVQLTYLSERLATLKQETQRVSTRNGVATLKLTPPTDAVSLTVQAGANNASSPPLTLRAGYSPSGTFVHLEQVGQGTLKVGDTARFKVSATREAANFYYEVLARGKVVFSDFSRTPEIALALTPLMAPQARLLVYQVLGTGEVAADYLPFKVEGSYPHNVQVKFDQDQAQPGDALDLQVQTEGPARVGLVAVDRSVFILAENRLNLQQVFDELERLYMKPQVELHEAQPLNPFDPFTIPGAKETFQEAGVVVLSNRQVPAGKQLQPPQRRLGLDARGPMMAAAEAAKPAAAPAATAAPAGLAKADGGAARSEGLAEVQRVRQFFPETWLWAELATDQRGRGTQKVTAPDSITTWMVRAVGLSKDKGLGIGEAQLRVFQPFFAQIDLPYSAIRGEEFPARIALYNYQQSAQEFTVELEAGDWFDALGAKSQKVTVGPNNVGSVAFTIRPTGLGVRGLKVTARSRGAADALVKELIVEPEGVQREVVENLVLAPGAPRSLDLAVPPLAIAGSARAYLALTGNMLSQTIEGLEGLLKMPFGCGEQNMILFAPNVFVSRYLKETSQLKPEVMARAEKLMLTGYQRQL